MQNIDSKELRTLDVLLLFLRGRGMFSVLLEQEYYQL